MVTSLLLSLDDPVTALILIPNFMFYFNLITVIELKFCYKIMDKIKSYCKICKYTITNKLTLIY